MSAGGRLIWLSPGSWVVGQDGVLCRPMQAEAVRGVGRSGLESTTTILAETEESSERRMYELFTSRGYLIADQDSAVVSIDGPIPPAEILRRAQRGGDVHLEEYLGQTSIRAWEARMLRPAAHADYFPPSLLARAMHSLLTGPRELPFTMPRVLFPQACWVIRRLEEELDVSLVAEVDNHTFPTQLLISQGKTDECRVLAATSYEETEPLLVLTEEDDWCLVCDGLIVI